MRHLRSLLSRLAALFSRRHSDADLDADIAAHLELLADEHRRRGLTDRDARAAARREFGNLESIKESYREQRGLPAVDRIVQDVRYSLRVLRRHPGFATAAVLSLALGIGPTVVIFGLLDAALLKPLPVRQPEGLVVVEDGEYSYPAYETFRDTGVFSGIFATSGITPLAVRVGATPAQRLRASLVSTSYFDVLGVRPAAGRGFTAADDAPNAPVVMIVSDHFWRRQLAGRGAIGDHIDVGASAATIVGIAPAAFFGERVGVEPDLWLPLSRWGEIVPGRDLVHSPTTSWLDVMGRLAPGISPAGGAAALTAAYRRALDRTFGAGVPADTRDEIAHTNCTHRLREPGVVEHPRHVCVAASGAHGGGGARAARRVRERGEPAARPRGRPAARDRLAAGTRHQSRASGPAAPHRMPPAFSGRRDRRGGARDLDARSAAAHGLAGRLTPSSRGDHRRQAARVHRGGHRRKRAGVRCGAGVGRGAPRGGVRDRHARRDESGHAAAGRRAARGRANRTLSCTLLRLCGAVPAHADQPPPGRFGLCPGPRPGPRHQSPRRRLHGPRLRISEPAATRDPARRSRRRRGVAVRKRSAARARRQHGPDAATHHAPAAGRADDVLRPCRAGVPGGARRATGWGA